MEVLDRAGLARFWEKVKEYIASSVDHTDNNYTDADKAKLAGLSNYDDTSITNRVAALERTAVSDADYVHTDNNYTNAEKTKLSGLENYDDTAVKNDITALDGKIADLAENMVSDADYVHTDNNYTDNEKDKLAGLENYDDTQIKRDISALASSIPANIVTDESYTHTDNNYTNEDKQKLDGLENYDDTQIRAAIAEKQNALTAGANITIDNDTISTDLSAYAKKTGDTFTGTVVVNATNIVQGGRTDNGSYKDFSVLRADGKRIAVIRFEAGASSNQVLIAPCSLETGTPLSPFPFNLALSGNTVSAYSVTPPANSNGRNIATTEWVRNYVDSVLGG